MGEAYIPASDAGALTWLQTFANGIQADPAKYSLSAPDSASISAAVAAYAAARTIAVEPTTRTPVTVETKDEAKAAAVALCRQYAILIKYNAGISNPDKTAIGVRPVNLSRDRVECPQTSPILGVVAATPGAQTVRFTDSMDPLSGAKPFGATEIQIYVAVADATVTDPAAARFYGKFTRNPIAVIFEHADNGKMATYFARWASRKGDTGNWSAPVSLAIAA